MKTVIFNIIAVLLFIFAVAGDIVCVNEMNTTNTYSVHSDNNE